jgi:hypothetical protein
MTSYLLVGSVWSLDSMGHMVHRLPEHMVGMLLHHCLQLTHIWLWHILTDCEVQLVGQIYVHVVFSTFVLYEIKKTAFFPPLYLIIVSL